MRSALRTLRQHWKLTAISAFSLSIALALGILALSISNTALLLPPSAPEPDRLVTVYDRTPTESNAELSYPDYEYYRQHARSFTDISAAPNSISISKDLDFEGRSVTVVTRPVSENYFSVLGIRPALGRFFAHGDEHEGVAIMTWHCWARLGSDRNIVGKKVAGFTIAGVAPKGFTGSFYGFEGDLFTTFHNYDTSPWRKQRSARRLVLTARLKPGVTRRQAQVEMTALSAQIASAFPKENQGRTAVLARASMLPPDGVATAEWMVAILMALVVLVLMIACANVANLLLAIAVGRRQEAAIKLALGAPRGRLVREFLVESTALCIFGGIAAYLIAAAVIQRYSHVTIVIPQVGPFTLGLDLRLGGPVAALSAGLVLAASLATGLAPALYASSPALSQILGGEIVVGGTRRRSRRNTLVILQVAVCTLVLIGMGLCERNIYNLRHIDLGFSARNLVSDIIYSEMEGHKAPQRAEFHETLRRTVAAIPGIEAVTLASHAPLMGSAQLAVQIPNEDRTISVAHSVVDQDYFATLGLKLAAGRAFLSTDGPKAQLVAIVNQKLAETLWPGQDAVGKILTAGEPLQRVLVVGVARNGKYSDLDEALEPFVYYPLSQHDQPNITLMARTKGDPRLWISPVATALRGLGLKIQVQPETFESWMTLSLLTQRIAAGFVGVLSGLGLLLAVIGLFGAISYSVSQRKKELGIRVALGAVPQQLLQMILRETAIVAGVGVMAGVLLGVAATLIFRSQMYGVSAVEWTVLIPVGLGMLALSLAVAALSARPWLSADPMDAVRHT